MSEYLVVVNSSSYVYCSYIDRQTVTSLADTTAWTGPRTLDQLVEFIIKSMSFILFRPSRV